MLQKRSYSITMITKCKKKLRMQYIVINAHMNVQEREQISTLAVQLKAIEKRRSNNIQCYWKQRNKERKNIKTRITVTI